MLEMYVMVVCKDCGKEKNKYEIGNGKACKYCGGEIMSISKKRNERTTVECYCGYIATIETYKFTCPDCGREYEITQGKNGGKIIQTKSPNNRYKRITTSLLISSRITLF